jgi:hypothetical protein
MFQVALALLLQLSLCMAAPITTQGTNWQGPTGGGVIGFIVLVLDIIAWGKFRYFLHLTIFNSKGVEIYWRSRKLTYYS